jgi:DNA adenine methylase
MISSIQVELPISYPGSKKTLMPRVAKLFPRHKHFVSVFGGSGAEILGKPRFDLETYNDINPDLFNMFNILRDQRSRLQVFKRLQFTLHSRREYETCLSILHAPPLDPVERAWAFLVAGNQVRAQTAPSLARSSTSWRRYIRSTRIARWARLPECLELIAHRFRDVQLKNLDWRLLLNELDSPETLFMLDPPYPHSCRVSKSLYRHEMSDGDHKDLLDRLQRVRGKVMIWTYPNELYQRSLGGWHRVEFFRHCTITSSPDKPPRTEQLWMNFSPNQQCG